MSENNFRSIAGFIWQIADILRGSFKAYEYGNVILLFVLLRRLDCVLRNKKYESIEIYNKSKDILSEPYLIDPFIFDSTGHDFYNISKYDLEELTKDEKNIENNFLDYINGFSRNVKEIIENYQIDKIITRLIKNNLLFVIISKFSEIDLYTDKISNHEMGNIFEELLRRFSEMSNETAGEHYTPREVIRLMVNILFAEHKEELQSDGFIGTIFDPACGTGGMLTVAKEYIKEINPDAEVVIYGQELNPQTYAIAKSDSLISDENDENIRLGNSFNEDKFKNDVFNFMFGNPPYGTSWKQIQEFIEKESKDPNGRFCAGLPNIDDGALLFLQHMISKMDYDIGSRIAIILNGSALFKGDAGSGMSNIRKWIIENDWLEAIIALPTEMFFNTGIATYIWFVANRKPERRKGKVQLINAVEMFQKMNKLGSKKNYISDSQIKEISEIYSHFEKGENCKIFNNEYFGYTKITVERPLMENGKIIKDGKGKSKPDSSLRDYEKVPLTVDIDDYFEKEVKPHVPDAWMDRSKDKVGYEINFNKYFYKYIPLRSSEEIKADILALEREIDKIKIVSNIITKGLNPDVKMKDSGIELVGMIPEHWDIKQIKYIGKIIGGFAFNSKDFTDNGIKVIKINNIQNMSMNWNNISYLPEYFYDKYIDYSVTDGSLILALTCPIIPTGIKTSIINILDDEKILINQRVGLFKPYNNVVTKFIYYIMNSEYFIKSFSQKIKTTIQPNISTDDIGDINIILPSKDEQIEIINYLDQIDYIIKKQEERLQFFKKYRISLISETMIGKLK